MICTERDGVVIENWRQAGITLAEKLAECYPRKFIGIWPLRKRIASHFPETPNLRFEQIYEPELSPNGNHVLAQALDGKTTYLIRDNQVLLRGDYWPDVPAKTQDFSRLAIVAKGTHRRNFFAVIDQEGQIQKPPDLEHQDEISVLAYSPELDRFLIKATKDREQSIHLVAADGTVRSLPIMKNMDQVRLLMKDQPKEPWFGYCLLAGVDEYSTTLTILDKDGERANEFQVSQPLLIDNIRVHRWDRQAQSIVWAAIAMEPDGSNPHRQVYRNNTLLVSGAQDYDVWISRDLQRVLTISSHNHPEDSAQITLNGQVFFEDELCRIPRYDYNNDLTFLIAEVTSTTADGQTRQLFYLTPKGHDLLGPFDSIGRFQVQDHDDGLENCLFAEVTEDGVPRQIRIYLKPQEDSPVVEEEPAV